ncbi:MAG TPA: hypothetical protein VLC09_13675, partial [Polyangiaceae bacterium]|nr:hypothetical protein [Polyangiaceae bacterium]
SERAQGTDARWRGSELGQAPWSGTQATPVPVTSSGASGAFSFAFDSPPPEAALPLEAPDVTAPAGAARQDPAPADAARQGAAPPEAPSSSVPQIRKLGFPSTRFAQSVGSKRPDLLDDSQADEAWAHPRPSHGTEAKPSTQGLTEQLSEPEDLLHHSSTPAASPDLRAFWQQLMAVGRARRVEALRFGNERARAGRRWAHEFRQSLRARQRPADTSTALPSDAAQSDAAQSSAPPSSAQSAATRSAAVSPAAMPRAAVQPAKRWLRRAAGPALTLALALGVHGVSSHWLGLVGTPRLAADVPDLGTLPAAVERDPRPPEQRKTPRPQVGAGSAATGSTATGSAPTNAAAPEKGSPSPQGESAPQVEMTELARDLAQPGKGGLEVVTSEDELIYVDGVFVGRGPLRRLPVVPGDHDVSIRSGGAQRRGTVPVEAGRGTRVLFVRPN